MKRLQTTTLLLLLSAIVGLLVYGLYYKINESKQNSLDDKKVSAKEKTDSRIAAQEAEEEVIVEQKQADEVADEKKKLADEKVIVEQKLADEVADEKKKLADEVAGENSQVEEKMPDEGSTTHSNDGYYSVEEGPEEKPKDTNEILDKEKKTEISKNIFSKLYEYLIAIGVSIRILRP